MHLYPHIFWILALALSLPFADGFAGGGFGWNKLTRDHGGPLHGRPGYYLALPLLALGYMADHVAGPWMVATWLIYRTALGFPTDTITGRRPLTTLLHHSIPLPAVALLTWITQRDAIGVLFPTLVAAVYAISATIIAVQYGAFIDRLAADPDERWDFNPFGYRMDPYNWFETTRGALFGLTVLAVLTA